MAISWGLYGYYTPYMEKQNTHLYIFVPAGQPGIPDRGFQPAAVCALSAQPAPVEHC